MKKKVLFYLWSYSLGGGAEKILSTVVNGLDREKYDIDIFEIEHFNKGYEKTPSDVRILKPVQSYRHPRWMHAILWRFRIYFPRLFRRVFLNNRYDVEVSFTVMNPPVLFTSRPDTRKIAWIHGSIEWMLTDEKMRKRYRTFLDQADRIVTVSELTEESVHQVFPEYAHKVIRIYNGYDFADMDRKVAMPCELKIRRPAVAVIGRIESLKGSDRVVEVAKLLKNRGKEVDFYFLGSGDMEEEIRHAIVAEGLADRVHLCGYQKNVFPILRQMNVLLSMSKMEGFPGTFVEALHMGVPFVTTPVGGSEELSREGRCGTVIRSEEEAAEAISERIEHPADPDMLRKSVEQYTVEEQIRRVTEVLEGKI